MKPATEAFFAFLKADKPYNVLRLNDEEFQAFDEHAKAALLSDYSVGQVWSYEGIHYLIPNSGPTHDKFHKLRSDWQTESSTE